MHGSVSLAHAEVDSMGEFLEGGVGIASKTSPRRAAIEKVQIELRQEYDVREERKRELEFLENGGNPLDFKLGNAASISVQSTSFTDQHPDLYTTSEPKVSFAFSASPRGDSVESSDIPAPPHCGPNSADNVMLFDTEHELSEGDRTSLCPSKIHVVPSEQSFQRDEIHKTTVPEDLVALGLPKKAYKRRYRSCRNREGTRPTSTNINPTCGSHGSSLPSRHTLWDPKELVSSSKSHHMLSNGNSESASPFNSIHQKPVLPDAQQDIELDGANDVESTDDLIKAVSVYASSDNIESENLLDVRHNQQVFSGSAIMPTQVDCGQPEAIHPMKEMTSSVIECQPRVTFGDQSRSCQMNGYSCIEGDALEHDADKSAPGATNGPHSDLLCSQNSSTINEKDVGEKFAKLKIFDSSGKLKSKNLLSDGAPVMEVDDLAEETKKIVSASACQIQQKNGFALQHQEERNQSGSTLTNDAVNQFNIERTRDAGFTGSQPGGGPAVLSYDNSGPKKETSRIVEPQNFVDISVPYLTGVASLTKVPHVSLEAQISSGPNSKLGVGNDEDSILKEAQIIEAKRKRIMELSIAASPVEIHCKSQWDYVLEEMSWLANDFAQERVWKIAAAGQICYRAMFSSQLRKQEKSSYTETKNVAHTCAKAVLNFWHFVKESSKELEQQSQKDGALPVVAYAVSFLKYNSNVLQSQTEVLLTPDRTFDLVIPDMPWDDNLTEENLFYTVPPRAMETYRKSIEFYESQCERFGNSMQEEVETSECDAATDNNYDEGEGDRSAYGMAIVFEGGDKSSRFGQKKQKESMRTYDSRTCEISSNVLGMQYPDIKVVTQQSVLPLKRRGSTLTVSIPTKRVRTASRRIISPFSAGTSGCMVAPNKTDVSSGDTSSFQDDQSTLHGGLFVPNSLETEFVDEFEKQLPFDSGEVSTKFKKKPKHVNAMHKQKWPVDSIYEQRGHWKKGSDVYQLESNGSDGLLVQPMIKRLKMRQSHDNCFDNNITPIAGSVTSPVASQTSNMFNANKTVKVIGGRDRDRNRKPKVLKMPAREPGSGSLWSLFEDQALVVLVHDLGPNWELISDAINDTLLFKRIFWKPKDCKDRHHVLMDGTHGDGADSAEDSGSSQPYPSTLPGIPKGSARQLFQRLQEPMDEDTLNSHFDKFIMLGQKQHNRKTQDPKQLQQPHSSHTIALSQVCPNNVNGGLVLTPLDFYEATLAAPELLPLGYQRPNSSMLTNPNQGGVTSMPPASGASTAFQGSSIMHTNSFPSPSSPFNSAVRDGRFGAPRSASLSVDEQQRMHQYGQMICGRNISQQNMTAPGNLPGTDRSVHGLSGLTTARPGLQGIVSSSMLNSGSMVSPVMASANMNSGVGSGGSLTRPRESSHMMRPAMIQDSQRQMMVPDLQIQVPPGNSQGMSRFGGSRSPYPNQASSPPVSSYPLHHQQSHPASPQPPQVLSPRHPHFQAPTNHPHNSQQQAYALHLAKERQLKQHFLQQQPQQQQFAVSNSFTPPPVHSQSQLPISSSMKNNFQLQSQTSSTPVSLSPLTSVSSMSSMPQHQVKHHTPTQATDHNAQPGGSGLTNQMGRQRQRQQQQSNRQHPLQRQQSQSHQQAKVLNGVGRVNPTVHQTIPIDPSLLNGVSINSGNQCLEKGEPAASLMQSQSLYTSSTQNSVQPKGQYISSQPCNQSASPQKSYSCQTSSPSKHQQITSQSNASSHGNISSVAPTGLSAVKQSVPSLAMAGANHQQATPHRKLVGQNQVFIRTAVRPTGPINSDPSNKPQSGGLDTVTSSSEPVLQAVQGFDEKPPPASLPPSKHDANVHWQQQPSQLLESQQPAPLPQQPPPQQQQALLPLHSQQQAKLLQAGNGNLYGRPSDTRI